MRAGRSFGEALALQHGYDALRLRPGYHVRLNPAASVNGHRDGIIDRIDGADIYVVLSIYGRKIEVHRYANEMELVSSDPENIAAAAEKDGLDKKNLDQMFSNCPAERLIGQALADAGIAWTHESHPDRAGEPEGRPKLDFLLDDAGLFIEVKLMHTPRIERQLAGVDNAIVVQGMGAARWLADLLEIKAMWEDAAMDAKAEEGKYDG